MFSLYSFFNYDLYHTGSHARSTTAKPPDVLFQRQHDRSPHPKGSHTHEPTVIHLKVQYGCFYSFKFIPNFFVYSF